jgi:Na+(H+)/acetate symporter ActP
MLAVVAGPDKSGTVAITQLAVMAATVFSHLSTGQPPIAVVAGVPVRNLAPWVLAVLAAGALAVILQAPRQ